MPGGIVVVTLRNCGRSGVTERASELQNESEPFQISRFMSQSTIPCPHCGGEIRSDAVFCRHCGSSDADGWKSADEDDPALDDFDYDEFVEENFSDRRTATQTPAIWRWVAIGLLVLFLLGYLLA